MKTILLFVGGWVLASIPVSFLIGRIFRHSNQQSHGQNATPVQPSEIQHPPKAA